MARVYTPSQKAQLQVELLKLQNWVKETGERIVVDQAATLGFRLGWREHARVGVPVTLASLLILILWTY